MTGSPASAPAADPVPRHFARPLVESDLAPVPVGWRVGPPDFVGLGQGKAGTSWWWSLLQQHPQVVPNRTGEKELHHFSHFGLGAPDGAAVELYRRAFAAPPGAVCGEFTCTYLSHPLALEHLFRAAPRARCIAMLRDPVERAASALAMWRRRRARFYGVEAERAHLLDAFSLAPEALHSSLVSDPLARAFELFGRENVLVLQFEQARRDPLAAYRRTATFLGLEAGFVPPDAARPVNAAPDREALDAADRERLVGWLRRDVERTFELCPDFEPELWPGFGSRAE